MKKMRRCVFCKSYTLALIHHERQTISAHPMQFNPNDRYGEFRRKKYSSVI